MHDTSRKDNILIVDDTPENLTVLRQMLARQGYQVRPALSGKIALNAIDKEVPDLILLDVLMPEMNGFEVCRILKSRPETSQIPVIFISALSEVRDVVEAFQAGGIDYIVKPFRIEEVLARVRNHLALRNAIRAREESQRMLQTVLDSIENTIVAVDENLQVISANRPVDDVCDGADDGRTFQERLNAGIGPCAEVLQQALDSRKPVKEYRVKCQCGGTQDKTLVLNAAPLIGDQYGQGGAVLVIRDISRLAALEESLIERHSYHNIIGKSEPMQAVFGLLERLADLEVNMLVCGESGTGKELIADAIHYASRRSSGPLVKVNCAALAEHLLESELFGHVRGAFTGAVKDRVGRCQSAAGGTLFLDEIGDISPSFQAKLLRFLEQKEFQRVGDSRTCHADVRVIAATNQDLAAKVREKTFREDLYFRLKGALIQLPPLRERREDTPLLSSHFITQFGNSLKKNIEGLSDDVKRIFMTYRWPGNVRELAATLHYACALCPEGLIEKEHLPTELLTGDALEPPARRRTDIGAVTIDGSMTEKERILEALHTTDWNKAKTARLLGCSRATLYTKLLKYAIEAPPDPN